MNNTARIGLVLPLLSLGLAGCTDGHPVSAPTAPSSISQPSPQPAPQPSPQPTGLQPTVTSITPNTGSTRGEAWVVITGTQFQSGARVTLRIDGSPHWSGGVARASVMPDGTISLTTSASAAGRVDVTVTNAGGLSSTLAGAYTFAPPETFDSNGDWRGDNDDDSKGNFVVQFTIRQNMLVSVSCHDINDGHSGAVLTLPSGSPVHNGEFSFLGDDGAAVSGRLVSPVEAKGTVNVGPCKNITWVAENGRRARGNKGGVVQSSGRS